MQDITAEKTAEPLPDDRLQHLPELRESIDELLALLRAHLSDDQNAALAAHVDRTSAPKLAACLLRSKP